MGRKSEAEVDDDREAVVGEGDGVVVLDERRQKIENRLKNMGLNVVLQRHIQRDNNLAHD